MLEFLSVLSTLLFVGGVCAYWWVSGPLRSLPNYYEQLAAGQKK